MKIFLNFKDGDIVPEPREMVSTSALHSVQGTQNSPPALSLHVPLKGLSMLERGGAHGELACCPNRVCKVPSQSLGTGLGVPERRNQWVRLLRHRL
jgi:hypothetical protein